VISTGTPEGNCIEHQKASKDDARSAEEIIHQGKKSAASEESTIKEPQTLEKKPVNPIKDPNLVCPVSKLFIHNTH
jgi:hypothetical protein